MCVLGFGFVVVRLVFLWLLVFVSVVLWFGFRCCTVAVGFGVVWGGLCGLMCIVRVVFCGFGSVVACVARMLIECCFCGFGDV